MRGGKHLLLLAALVLVTSQQKPQVLMLPDLKQVYSGDLFVLSCDNSPGVSTVKWYFNGMESAQTSETWRFAVATAKHSGSYHCEIGVSKSEALNITVMEWLPRASLILETGQPVMQVNGSVILQIENEDGLHQSKWRCFVHKGGMKKKMMLRLKNDTVRLSFQPNSLGDPENIFWCADKELRQRSNQIVVWTSDKRVSLEMFPMPVMAGESLTVTCLVWGTDKISQAVFYVNNSAMNEEKGSSFKIPHVTKSEKGSYKCWAKFTYPEWTAGPSYTEDSDLQELYVYESPVRAELSGKSSTDLSCSCPRCPEKVQYRWYRKDDSTHKTFNESDQRPVRLWGSGTYSCRAVWEEGRSLLSKSYEYQDAASPPVFIIIILLVVLGLACVAVGFCIRCRRRRATGEIYEDVHLNKLDNQYEALQGAPGARREGEYDTLHAGATGKKEDEHQSSQKDHALGKEGPEGGAGGYEALRRGGGKEEVYHTLGEAGTGSGGGGYEALKRQEKQVEIYHTLELAGTATAKGGHEENVQMTQEK